jgi:hypothetical protein
LARFGGCRWKVHLKAIGRLSSDAQKGKKTAFADPYSHDHRFELRRKRARLHSDAPGEEGVKETKLNLGCGRSDAVLHIASVGPFVNCRKERSCQEKDWNSLVNKYEKEHPNSVKRSVIFEPELPDGWEKSYEFDGMPRRRATRAYSGEVIKCGRGFAAGWSEVRLT